MREFAQWLEESPLSVFIKSVVWIIPTVQTIHIVTVGVVFVSMLMIALRVLGLIRTDQAFGDVLKRFTPWLWGGLAVMTATGLILVLGEPVREFYSSSFWVKMLLLAVAVASGAYFLRAIAPAKLASLPGAGAPEFSLPVKYAAGVTIALWLGVIFLGRAIAYDIEVWGDWSLASARFQ